MNQNEMCPMDSTSTAPGEVVSLASGVSTESGIHMGSDHDTVNNFNTGRPRLILVEGESLTKILKHVKRSQSYNVSDLNKDNRRRKARPKSQVYGRWEGVAAADQSISPDDLYHWQRQLRQMAHHRTTPTTTSASSAPPTTATNPLPPKKPPGTATKLPKKESLRQKATTLIFGWKGARDKKKSKNSSFSSSYTEEDRESSSSVDKSGYSGVDVGTPSKVNTTLSSDVLTILKVFAGTGLQSSPNAEYRSVLATVDSTVLEVKKQAISKYSLPLTDPTHYSLILSTGRYLDGKGNTISSKSEGFGSKSECWKEDSSEVLPNTAKPLEKSAIVEDLDSCRLELRCLNTDGPSVTTGLHSYPTDGPFLILIQGNDRQHDRVVYPLSEGVTLFTGQNCVPAPSFVGSLTLLHTTEPLSFTIHRKGPVCMLEGREKIRCGQTLRLGRFYKFIFRDSIENDIAQSPDVGSPDTQRTLSTGTLTSASPELGVISLHHHAEPRFIFPSDQAEPVFTQVFSYELLMAKYPLGIAYTAIMCLRHAADHMSLEERGSIAALAIEHLAALARRVQARASRVLAGEEAGSAVHVVKPMTRLLANGLELGHFMREQVERGRAEEVERVCVAMFEFVAYHVAKMVYELLPGILDNTPPPPTATSTPSSSSSSSSSSYVGDNRRWSMPCAGDRMPPGCSLSPVTEDVLSTHSRSAEELSTSAKESPKLADRSTVRSRQDLTCVGSVAKRLVSLLQRIHSLGRSSKLNSAIVKQLFASTFFFANTTLFNTIMESPEIFFNWEKGVQIHVQMDYLLKWAHQVQLSHTAVNHFKEVNQLLDLLSLPKRDLLSSDWSALARAFPGLSPVQLNHVLCHYNVAQKPRIWRPSPPLSLVPDSTEASVTLKLSSYPPLSIPTRGYRIARSSDLPDLLRSSLAKLTTLISKGTPSESTPATPTTLEITLHAENSSLGLKLKRKDSGVILVTAIVPGSPAQGKVREGDEVAAINDQDVTGTSIRYCKKLIEESEGDIKLKVARV